MCDNCDDLFTLSEEGPSDLDQSGYRLVIDTPLGKVNATESAINAGARFVDSLTGLAEAVGGVVAVYEDVVKAQKILVKALADGVVATAQAGSGTPNKGQRPPAKPSPFTVNIGDILEALYS